jgi:hypothetical protein
MSEAEAAKLLAQAKFQHAGDNLCRKMEGLPPRVMGQAYALVSPILGVLQIAWDTKPMELDSDGVGWSVDVSE